MGSAAREAYLLLKLFEKALHYEVEEKFKKPSDASTGHPVVLKLAISYARQTGGSHPLQYILAPLIYKVCIVAIELTYRSKSLTFGNLHPELR